MYSKLKVSGDKIINSHRGILNNAEEILCIKYYFNDTSTPSCESKNFTLEKKLKIINSK